MGLELLSLDQRQIWPTGLSFTSEKQTLNSKVNTPPSTVATTMQLNICFSDSGEERRMELMSWSVTPPSARRPVLGQPSRPQLPACFPSALVFLTFPAGFPEGFQQPCSPTPLSWPLHPLTVASRLVPSSIRTVSPSHNHACLRVLSAHTATFWGLLVILSILLRASG